MTKTEIIKNYNVDKIISAKDLVQLSKTYKDNLETIIVMMKRKTVNPPQPPAWFVEWNNNVFEPMADRLTKIEKNQIKDHNLLLKVIKLNNLKTK